MKPLTAKEKETVAAIMGEVLGLCCALTSETLAGATLKAEMQDVPMPATDGRREWTEFVTGCLKQAVAQLEECLGK